MIAHRLLKARHASSPLDGEGARRLGGRWNAPGRPVAYCSSTLSLALLELLVHVDPGDLPSDLVAVRIEIPDDLKPARVDPTDLPGNWRTDLGRSALRAIGGDWLAGRKRSLLLVPSVIVPAEMNILIDPAHPDASRIRVVGLVPFELDPRFA